MPPEEGGASGKRTGLVKPDGTDRQDQDELTNEHSQGQR